MLGPWRKRECVGGTVSVEMSCRDLSAWGRESESESEREERVKKNNLEKQIYVSRDKA